jgi:hypothetical protein
MRSKMRQLPGFPGSWRIAGRRPWLRGSKDILGPVEIVPDYRL